MTLVAIAVAFTVQTAIAVDVKVDFDRAFNFKAAHTWGWNPQAPGDVKMARTQTDDPEAMRMRAEPIILAAVEGELTRRGLQFTTGTPDLVATYFLLLSNSSSAQTIGQFIPSVTEWGLPPFNAGTQSLKMMHRGSLVLDFTAKEAVVWRGVAQANIDVDAKAARREALINEAVRDLLRRFPPRS
jgi:hypothetical protein